MNSNLRDDILAAPPIGLCYVATALDRAGHEVRVLDLCFHRRVERDLKEAVRRFAPEVVGVSVRNIDNVNLLHPVSYVPEAVGIVRALRGETNAPVVLGGSGASLIPAPVLTATGADYLVVSHGEDVFVRLLAALEQGGDPGAVPGVALMRRGAFHLTPPQREDGSFGQAHLGRWLDLRPYRMMGGTYTVQSKRGCPHRCIYCSYNQLLEGPRLRLREPGEVVDELEEACRRFQPQTCEFVDSVFNEPREHAVAILEEVVRRGLKTNFTAMGLSPRGLDRELLQLMWRAGFRSFMMSPDAGSPTMLHNYRKGFGLEDLIAAAQAIAATRFTVLWYFLLGGPGETMATLAETLQFAKSHLFRGTKPPYHMANFFLGVRLYPGTDLWDLGVREGFVAADAEPLQQIWYLSHRLDLEEALRRLYAAAASHPEVILGSVERYLPLTRHLTTLGNLLRLPQPFWRHAWGVNRILGALGLRRPPDVRPVAAAVRQILHRQGCRDPWVKQTGTNGDEIVGGGSGR